MAGLLISDGETGDFCLKVDGFPDLNGRYRAVLPEEVFVYRDGAFQRGKKEFAAAVKFISEHFQSWDASAYGSDDSVPCTADNIKRLPPQVFDACVDFLYTSAKKRGEKEKN